MAVWKKKVAGCEVQILNVDHMPPHCHIAMPAKELKVDLHTLKVINLLHTSFRRLFGEVW